MRSKWTEKRPVFGKALKQRLALVVQINEVAASMTHNGSSECFICLGRDIHGSRNMKFVIDHGLFLCGRIGSWDLLSLPTSIKRGSQTEASSGFRLTKVRITKRSPGLPLWAAAPFRAILPEPLGEGIQ